MNELNDFRDFRKVVNKTLEYDSAIAKLAAPKLIGGEDDFEIIVFPDTQNMVENNYASGKAMADWVAANKNTLNIKAVLHVGDITNNPLDVQFARASGWYQVFENAGVPALYTAGNHDYQPGWSIPGRDLTLFNTYFGPSRYAGKSHYISSVTGTRGESSAIRFSAGNKNFVAVSLELFPRADTITWATNLITSLNQNEPNTEVIIITHAYMDYFGDVADENAVYSTKFYGVTDGIEPIKLFNTFISKMPNIRYVIGGHFLIPNSGAPGGLISRTSAIGDYGNTIHQIFVNYQDDNRTGVINGLDYTPGNTGGNGFLMRMQFSPSNGTVTLKFYSPALGAFDPDQSSIVLDMNTNTASKYKDSTIVDRYTRVNQKGEVTFKTARHSMVIPNHNEADIYKTLLRYGGQHTSTFFGVNALGSDSTKVLALNWFQNTAFGYGALQKANGVNDNTAFGAWALGVLTAGSENTAVGRDCLGQQTTGSYNTAIGLVAGYDITTGTNNVLVGRRTGRGITTGSNNIVIGDAISGLAAAQTNAIMIGQAHTRNNVAQFGKSTQTFNIGCAVADYADNTAAKTGGLQNGDVYKTGDILKVVHP